MMMGSSTDAAVHAFTWAMEFSHLYTVEEAQAKLVEILPELEEMMRLKRECDRKGYDVYKHQYFGGMGPNGMKAFPAEMEELADMAAAFDDEGIQVKDLDTGLIDFPHRRKSGEIVLLCFKYGEAEITAWHTLAGGFSARQPLAAL
jgi:hypothetical protein